MNKNVFICFLTMLLVFGFIGCDNSNGDEEVFVSSTNETILNDISSLGLVGTSVSSSNEDVVTVVIASGKIRITSIGNGSTVITVSENTKNATINISVSKTGIITIGTITKYVENVKMLIGNWTKTISTSVYLLVINNDGTWNVSINGTPQVSENPGIWSEINKTIGIWYSYISETHPEPGYVYATYILSENGDSFTLSGEAELLLGGTDPWTRINL